MATPVNLSADHSFGPQLDGQFDFTLLFEQVILTILPASVLLGVSPLYIAGLFRKTPAQVRPGALLWAKIGLGVTLAAVEAAALGVWTLRPTDHRYLTATSVAAAALSLAVALCVLVLLWAQHRHSVRPSSLLGMYLSVAILLDAAQIRSLYRRPGLHVSAGILVTATVLKGSLLLLEEFPKRALLYRKADAATTSREAVSGFWNRRLFLWVNSTLWRGFRSILVVDNLQHIDSDFDSAALLLRMEDQWEQADKSSSHSLLKASAVAHAGPVSAAIVPRLMFIGFTFAQPFLLNTIVEAVGGPHIPSNTAHGLIGATVLIYLGIALSRGCYMHLNFRFLTMLRGSLVSLILNKSLRLQSGTDAASAAVTHMSTDIDSIVQGLETLHDTWASVIELAVGAYMMSRYVGGATALVIVPAIVSAIGSVYLGAKLAPAKVAWNKKIEERVSRTSDVLAQLKGIKMMGLGPWFFDHIQHLRVVEVDYSKRYRTLLITMYSTGQLTLSLAPILVIAGGLFWTNVGGGLTPAQAFSTLSIIMLVSQPFAMLMLAVPILWSVSACFARIQSFLLLPERVEQRSVTAKSPPSDDSGPASGPKDPSHEYELRTTEKSDSNSNEIHVLRASFVFESSPSPVLNDVSFDIAPSSFVAVIGGVGSGKTTLLRAILGEVRMTQGEIHIGHASIAYCGQASWLRNSSVRENVLGEDAFDQVWYNTVMDACLLNEDADALRDGFESLVGSGGSTLSGGQRQRVALARAVYSRKKILLLDDVFSALDKRTASAVFSRLLGGGGLLRRSGITVVLTTHDPEFVSSADLILRVEIGGSVSVRTSNQTYEELGGDARGPSNAKDGEANKESVEDKSASNQVSEAEAATQSREPTIRDDDEIDVQRQGGNLALYRFYFQSVKKFTVAAWLVLTTLYVLTSQMPNVWVRIWLATAPENNLYFIGYAGWAVLGLLLGFAAIGFFLLRFVPESAENLHRTLLDIVMRQPLWHFTAVDSGNTLNRFSQDMTLVSQELPMAFFLVTFFALTNVTTIAIIASGANYTAVMIPFLMVALYLLQNFYLRTSRQMRHLDLEAKSPLYSLFTEIASGIQHIRSFNWQGSFLAQGLRLLDVSQKPYYLLFCVQRWLTLVLDMFVLAIAAVLVTCAVKVPSTTAETAIGLALVNLVGYGESLAQLIQYWTNLETSLGAIARLRTYVDKTPVEKDPSLPCHPSEDWPDCGKIEIQSLNAKYNMLDASAIAVLDDISLTIHPGQKVGVIGRTGSGKSSLMLALLHLLDISGSVKIDGVDITSVTLQHLRSHVTTITQDPVTLPGSVRTNLLPGPATDAFLPEAAADADDDAAIAALSRVGILERIQQQGGLDADLAAMQLSAGEMQLLCLARALLHNAGTRSRVVLVDEATSNMDRDTEARARQVFKGLSASGCTVIMIAHRADMVEDADVILELSHGRISKIYENRNDRGEALQ